jgi:hypothetical protein
MKTAYLVISERSIADFLSQHALVDHQIPRRKKMIACSQITQFKKDVCCD